tara:strand:+ start:126 stop:305 length:180 start_codon:yes stop_codon:yes gene_type:complete
MKNEIKIINNLIDKMSDKHTLLGKDGHSWNGLLRSDIRFSMSKLIEAKEIIERNSNWIK